MHDRWRPAALLAAALLAAGCGKDPRTQVMAFVRAEEGVRARADRLEVEIYGGAPGEARALRETLTYTDSTSDAFFPLEWPRRVAIVPSGGDVERTFAVVATAFEGDAVVARAEVASSFLPGQTLTLDVWLRDACIGVSCDAGSTCVAGACRPVDELDPCQLRRLEDDDVPEGCAPPDAGAGDAGATDAGATDAGPTDAGPLDAGPPDGGPPDAGIDGGPPSPLDIYNVVFVSSTTVVPSELGGIDAAHTHCQDLAAAAGLSDPASFRAFLSVPGTSATTLLAGSRGWVRPDGLPFLDQPSDLADGKIFYPVALTETGAPPLQPLVVTGTGANLQPAASCAGWTVFRIDVTVGNSFDGAPFWVDRRFGFDPRPPIVACNTPLSLYCFGTGRNVPLTPSEAPAGAGRVFVSSATVPTTASDGIAPFDAVCRSEGGSDDYVAFLPADGTGTAIARLGGFGGPWARPDGVVVAENVTDLASEALRAPPNQTAFGVYEPVARVWSPEIAPSTPGGITCEGWSSSAGPPNGRFSYTGRTERFYSAAVSRTCDGAERVLCFSTAPL